MITKGVLSCLIAALGIGLLPTGAAAAVEATPTASVRITDRPAVLRPDGGVRLVIAARCDASLQAFELDVSVAQYQASGSLFRLAPPAVVMCDGLRHRQRVIVYPSTGAFSPGNATVSVFLGLYDPQADRDLGRDDTATVTVTTA
ncbi:MAG: hypothetical protein ACJ74E_07425 [Actinomycetes bacterium]